MRFEERELKPYAEPISSNELHEGSIYFTVNHIPGDMTIPIMETLVFIGRNLEPSDAGRVYFQDVRSYFDGVRYDDDVSDRDVDCAERLNVLSGSDNELGAFFDYDRALEQLMKCSLRRRKLDEGIQMRWEGRELNPNAEPVSPTEIEEGQLYFNVAYADDDKLVAVMQTLVFIGRDLGAGDEGKWYFQDVEAYQEGITYSPDLEDEWSEFHAASEKELVHIFEFERAPEELMRCSLRRRKA